MKRLLLSPLLVFISLHLSAHIVIKDGFLTPATNVLSKSPVTENKLIINSIPVPQLGTMTNFALFTVAGAVGNTGISNITGNVGANVGAITGFGGLNGTTYNADAVTAQGVTDLMAAYNQISAIPSTATHGAVLGNGETVYSGVYSMPGAGSAAGVLTLDAQGDPNAEFIFQIGGAFTTGASTTVTLLNGASANNIYWVAEGAISMATLTIMKGTLIAHNAAVSMGASGSLQGRMLSTTGAVSVYGDGVTIPVSSCTWIGAISTNWNIGGNWRNGVVPGATDDSFIGVTLPFTYFPNVPASSGAVSVGSIAFGTMGGQAAGVLVNTGSTLIVLRAITYQSDTSSGLGYTCTLSGPGAITANSISVIANTALANSYGETFASSVTNLNVATNITLTSSNNGAALLNASFNLTGGTASITGLLQTTNTATSTSSFTVSPATIATLQLVDANALSGLSATGTNVITFNNSGASVEYSGVSQTVYTDAGITGLTGGVSYQNIKFSGSGVKTASTGNLNIAGDYGTTMVNDASNYVDLTSPAVNFNGTAQNLTGGAGNGTTLYNVTFSGAGLKTMTGGNFYIASNGVLTMAGNSANTVLATGGFLTLHSAASGSASVAAIASGGPIITGNVNVERYISGGAGYRGYRVISSPVYAATVGSGKVYSINYLQNSMYLSGNAGGGFDKAGNPSIYLYREDLTPSNAGFTTGDFWGISAINNSPAYNYSVTGAAVTVSSYIPVGAGFMVFFRGNRASASLATATTLPYPTPIAVTAVTTGQLNQGQVIATDWYTPGSSYLGYTGTGTGSNHAARGFNLVGNPYASSIDWDTYNTTSATTGIYANNVAATIYEFNPATSNYGVYQKGGVSTNNGSNIIMSGQGFFVLATSSASPQLIFNETAKSNTQNTGPTFFMTTHRDLAVLNNTNNNPYLRLQMAMDSVNTDDTYIGFNAGASPLFNNYDDSPYKEGRGEVKLASFSSDSVRLAINKMQLPGLAKIMIPLSVTARQSGTFSLKLTELKAIPELYDIWLMDGYRKDSLDIRHNPAYTFDITADTTSNGNNRFQLVIRQNAALMVHLLNFTATKVTGGTQEVWLTENEQNYTNFTVERSINGGADFTTLGGYVSSALGTYGFLDQNPAPGVNLYRLKLIDLNGTVTYSNIATVMYGNGSSLVKTGVIVYPNPAKDMLNLTVAPGFNNANQIGIQSPGPSAVAYTIQIINVLGSVVTKAATSEQRWQTNVSSLMPGTYIIKVNNTRDNSAVGQSTFVKL